jgi:hypothetical protein
MSFSTEWEERYTANTHLSVVSFPRFFAFQPDGIMPPISVHADA